MEAYQKVAAAMGQNPPKKEPSKFQKIVDYFINDSIPAQAVKAAYSGFTLPRDVYQGKVDPLSNEAIDRSADLAGMVTLGAGAIPAEKNTLRAGIKAYHGSPHDFDKFSMGKIGTGEGAQAYGHGLYFADSEDVAKAYRDALTKGSVKQYRFRGQDIKPNTPEWDLAYRAFQSSDGIGSPMGRPFSEALDQVVKNYRAALTDGRAERYGITDQIFEFLRRVDGGEITEDAFELKTPGHMYEVNINANPDDFLDWDKPLSEQPQRVRDALAAMDPDTYHPSGSDYDSMEPGQMIYQRLAAQKRDYGIDSGNTGLTTLGGAQAGATSDLQGFGIAGVKYLDQGSRAAGEGSRNYVVFDDSLIEIVRKYGVAGALAAGLLTQEQAKQFMQQGPTQSEWEKAYNAGTGA